MFVPARRPAAGRITLWVILTLLVAFGLLVGYQLWNRERHVVDAKLLQVLQTAELPTPDRRLASSGEWPQWRGPNRDGLSQETGLRTIWPPQGPKVLWEAEAGPGYSSLAVSDGRVYTLVREGSNEVVVCWDAATGEERWRTPYACPYQNDQGAGPRSTPAVDGDRVYTVGATGIFHCLDAKTGEVLWRHDLLEEFDAPNLRWGVSFSPLVQGELVFTNPGGPGGNSIAAFHKHLGTLVWKALDDPAGYSSPIAVTIQDVPQILFFTGRGLVGVAPDSGKLYWRYDWETSHRCNIATPIAVGDYVFISSGYGKGCALLKIDRQADGSWQAQPVYENNRMCNHFSSSVRYQEHFYGFHDPGFLTCMDLRTGEVVWKERGFKKGSLLIADGHLIILGENGRLAIAEATPEGYREKSSFQVSQERCWTAPVLANGKLYVRDEKKVVCLDLKQ